MEQYIVTGMSCAACQARVEKAVSKVPGVESCAVSLLTNSMGVEGTASADEIIKAVEKAGYGARPKGSSEGKQVKGSGRDLLNVTQKTDPINPDEDVLADHETPVLKRRLILSAFFLLVLMYITMGHHMLHLPLPSFLHHNYIALAIIQMFLALIVMCINRKFFTSGFGSLVHGAPNMDTLVAMGSAVSFLWSLAVLFQMTSLITAGNPNSTLQELYHKQLYFESAAMIPALITVGKMLEAMSKGRTTNALKSLMRLSPKTAVLLKDGVEVEVGIEEVKIGDIFVVRPGMSIPVDGIVLEGESAVNEAALTGESIPADKTAGSRVSAATINQSGYIKCQATRVGEDTTLSQIIKMVSDAAATKAPIARIADKVSGVFVPAVIAIAAVVTAGWVLAGETWSFALARGISVLVISCPCALGLATPVAIMVGNGIGARHGILFKTSEALETAGRVQVVALDKTGTITRGEPRVTDIIPAAGVTSGELLEKAYALEAKSEHPLAKAIVAEALSQGAGMPSASGFSALSGAGVTALIDGKKAHGGSAAYIRTLAPVDVLAAPDSDSAYSGKPLAQVGEALATQGKTPLFFEQDGRLLGIIAVADVVKPDSAEAIEHLRNMGLKVVMLTGDNKQTAKAIGSQVGVDDVIAGVLPDGKEAAIRKIQKSGKVAMVGDGINDAPALTRADIGIAIGAGADVAVDSADIVLVNSTLSDVATAVELSRRTLRNIHENLFWAFFYNLICIPLAAGLLGWKMNPMIGAAAMSLSSFTVCMNALRLNLFRPKGQDKEKTNRRKNMKKTVKIEGMMCPHCEANVKNTLEALGNVTSAEVSHKAGTAILSLSGDVDNAVIKKAVEDKGYKVVSIQ